MGTQPLLGYRREIEMINRQLEIVTKLDRINIRLHQYHWIFLHPYSQGMDIGILDRLLNESSSPEEEILKFFAHKFLDLRNTVHHLEGFFPTRPFIKEYVGSIKESFVLCLQKDYRGAIGVLLPVIEGVLRKYLVFKKGKEKKSTISFKELITSLDGIKSDYLEMRAEYFQKWLDRNQQKQLMAKYDKYFSLWMKQFRGFLSNNLYLDTRKNDLGDNFNRHIIFHSLDYKVDYTFSNYLRLFNCILYLSWAIGSATKGCSILSEADESLVNRECANYMNILIVSEVLTATKSEIYGKKLESFKEYLHPKYLNLMKSPETHISIALRFTDILKAQ